MIPLLGEVGQFSQPMRVQSPMDIRSNDNLLNRCVSLTLNLLHTTGEMTKQQTNLRRKKIDNQTRVEPMTKQPKSL